MSTIADVDPATQVDGWVTPGGVAPLRKIRIPLLTSEAASCSSTFSQ
jgi:hypothetical protein